MTDVDLTIAKVAFSDLIEKHAADNALDPNLVRAICSVESSFDQWAIRYEPQYQWLFFPRESASHSGVTTETETICQKMSFGLMQIMGAVAREYGLKGPLTQLCNPDINIKYGCELLHKLEQKYLTEADVISAYNMGHPGKTPGGMYLNQSYVDKVHAVLYDLRKLT